MSRGAIMGKQLQMSWILWCLASACAAQAAQPVTVLEPAPAGTRPGACALALHTAPAQQQQPAQPQGPAQPPAAASADDHNKVNMDFLFDPCKLDDAAKDSAVNNNTGASPKDGFIERDEWGAWNRRLAGVKQDEVFGMAWEAADPHQYARQHDGLAWPEPAGSAPAVPEPAAGLLWLAGLPLLALALRRRQRR
ncbi:hypothetical protein [Duganella sp. BuS-21]|uniref:hypothetical protein n=1 Tax=Duganella sp. BuS-21 TaxID=2943848 RepID=UPI0035A70B7D